MEEDDYENPEDAEADISEDIDDEEIVEESDDTDKELIESESDTENEESELSTQVIEENIQPYMNEGTYLYQVCELDTSIEDAVNKINAMLQRN